MDIATIIISIIALVFLVLMGVVALRVARESSRDKSRANNLRQIGRYDAQDSSEGAEVTPDDELIVEEVRKVKKKKKEPGVEELLFMAGRFSQSERDRFHKRKTWAPIVFGFVGVMLGLFDGSSQMILLSTLAGVLLGFYVPMKVLRGWVKKQHEDLSYYLPLMIEQISIGVSSSLDIGPCIGQLVQMADERDSHNPATDLLKHALFYVKSGVSLEQALSEIGRASGQPEFKQALLALSQVTKFGGEVSKQLQELADSVGSQREAKIEGEIRKLELKATVPVSLVFLSYMMLFGLGIAAQVMAGMNN